VKGHGGALIVLSSIPSDDRGGAGNGRRNTKLVGLIVSHLGHIKRWAASGGRGVGSNNGPETTRINQNDNKILGGWVNQIQSQEDFGAVVKGVQWISGHRHCRVEPLVGHGGSRDSVVKPDGVGGGSYWN